MGDKSKSNPNAFDTQRERSDGSVHRHWTETPGGPQNHTVKKDDDFVYVRKDGKELSQDDLDKINKTRR